MTTLRIRGARLADGSPTDLAVADGHFVDSADLTGEVETIEADGLLALPGLVDLHTHLREPGNEEAETVASGTRAAARGGFTAVFAMANLRPVTDTPERAVHISELGRNVSAQVLPVGAITKGLEGHELADIAGMASVGVRLFSDDGKCVMDAGLMARALEAVAAVGGVLAQHSQDHNLAGPSACCHESEWSARLELDPWPAEAESIIIARDVQLAKRAGAHLHVCHISTADGVDVVRWAKRKGIHVTAEVTPHHLYLMTPELQTHSTTFKVNPPLRTAEHVEAVRQALADGTIDAVGTDHAPHRQSDKDKPFPQASPGMLGLEQALAVVMETMVRPGRLDWPGVVERMSRKPAEIGGLLCAGDPFAVGAPASLVLVDPESRTHVDPDASLSRSRNNPYAHRNLPDPIVATICRGRLTYRR